MKTLPVGIAAFAPVIGTHTQLEGYALAMAGVTILTIPSLALFFFLQRYFIQGIAQGGSRNDRRREHVPRAAGPGRHRRPRIASIHIEGAGPAASGETFETIDPSTEEPLAEVARGDAADVDAAARRHAPALDGPLARGDAAEARRADVQARRPLAAQARRASRGSRRSTSASRSRIRSAMSTASWRRCATTPAPPTRWRAAPIPLGPDFIDFTMLEPLGVTAHIVPWNYPLGMAMRSLAPALAAGCTAVLKPAEQSPLTALALAELGAAGRLSARRRQRRHRLRRGGGRGARPRTRWCAASPSPARSRPGRKILAAAARASSRRCWSSAARTR